MHVKLKGNKGDLSPLQILIFINKHDAISIKIGFSLTNTLAYKNTTVKRKTTTNKASVGC